RHTRFSRDWSSDVCSSDLSSSKPESKIMRIAAQPGHAQFLALEILRSFDFRLGENAVGQGVFGARDEYQIGRPLGESAYDGFTSADGDLAIAAQDRSRHQWCGRNVNHLKVQSI